MESDFSNDNAHASTPLAVRLDGLIAEIGRYNTRAAQGHIEPFPYAERKAKLIGIARELIALQPTALPPYATQAARQLNDMLHAQTSGNPPSPRPDAAIKLAEELRTLRRGVMRRRPSHKPEERWHLNQESEPQMAFLRQFVQDVDCDLKDAGNCARVFPHVTQYRHHAEGILLLHAFAGALRAQLRPYFADGAIEEDFTADARYPTSASKSLALDIEAAKHAFCEMFDALPWKEPSIEFYASVRAQIATGLREALGSRQAMRNFIEGLDYQACSEAHKALSALSVAYKSDRALWRAEKQRVGDAFIDPRQEPYRLLETLTRARWALAADEVGALWKSNARILGDAGIPVRDAGKAEGQGRLL